MFVGKKIKSLVINEILENVEKLSIFYDIDEVSRPGPIFTVMLKFIYSEKAKKICKISTNYLSYVLPVK